MNNLSPVCLFTYNRLDKTKQTIDSLKKNFLAAETDLFIFSDGSKNENDELKVLELRKYLQQVSGFKSIEIFESKRNQGLANSIINGVTKIINEFDKVIVLEDDLITSSNFLNFMNSSLNYYDNCPMIMSINGFSLDLKSTINYERDIFFMNRTYSWGWATWKSKWTLCEFDKQKIQNSLKNIDINKFKNLFGEDIFRMLLASLNGKNDSWYVRWVYSHFVNSQLSVYPVESKVINIGYGDSATHCATIDVLKSRNDKKLKVRFILCKNYMVQDIIRKEFLYYFTKRYKLLFRIKLMKSLPGIKLLLKDIKHKIYNF